MRSRYVLAAFFLSGLSACWGQVPSGATEIPLAGEAGGGRSVLFIDGGKKLLVGRKQLVETYDVGSKAVTGSLKVKGGVVNALLPASPDATRAVAAAGTTLTTLDIATMKAIATITAAGPEPRFAAVDVSGSAAIFAAGTEVSRFDLESGTAKDKVPASVSAPLAAFALSPDGKQIAFAIQGTTSGDVIIADVQTGKTITQIAGKAMNAGMAPPAIGALTFSPDSKHLAVTVGLGPTRIYSTDAKLVAEFSGDAGVFAVFSPDSSHLARVTQDASMERAVTIYRVSDKTSIAKHSVGNLAINAVTFSQDHSSIAVAPAAKAVYLFALSTK